MIVNQLTMIILMQSQTDYKMQAIFKSTTNRGYTIVV
jgi:hypothetical protein